MDPKGDRLRKIQSGQLKLPDSVLKSNNIVFTNDKLTSGGGGCLEGGPRPRPVSVQEPVSQAPSHTPIIIPIKGNKMTLSTAEIPLPSHSDIPLPEAGSIPLPSTDMNKIPLPEDSLTSSLHEDIPLPQNDSIPLPVETQVSQPTERRRIKVSLSHLEPKGDELLCRSCVMKFAKQIDYDTHLQSDAHQQAIKADIQSHGGSLLTKRLDKSPSHDKQSSHVSFSFKKNYGSRIVNTQPFIPVRQPERRSSPVEVKLLKPETEKEKSVSPQDVADGISEKMENGNKSGSVDSEKEDVKSEKEEEKGPENRLLMVDFVKVQSKDDSGRVLDWPKEMIQYTKSEPNLMFSCNPLSFDFSQLFAINRKSAGLGTGTTTEKEACEKVEDCQKMADGEKKKSHKKKKKKHKHKKHKDKNEVKSTECAENAKTEDEAGSSSKKKKKKHKRKHEDKEVDTVKEPAENAETIDDKDKEKKRHKKSKKKSNKQSEEEGDKAVDEDKKHKKRKKKKSKKRKKKHHGDSENDKSEGEKENKEKCESVESGKETDCEKKDRESKKKRKKRKKHKRKESGNNESSESETEKVELNKTETNEKTEISAIGKRKFPGGDSDGESEKIVAKLQALNRPKTVHKQTVVNNQGSQKKIKKEPIETVENKTPSDRKRVNSESSLTESSPLKKTKVTPKASGQKDIFPLAPIVQIANIKVEKEESWSKIETQTNDNVKSKWDTSDSDMDNALDDTVKKDKISRKRPSAKSGSHKANLLKEPKSQSGKISVKVEPDHKKTVNQSSSQRSNKSNISAGSAKRLNTVNEKHVRKSRKVSNSPASSHSRSRSRSHGRHRSYSSSSGSRSRSYSSSSYYSDDSRHSRRRRRHSSSRSYSRSSSRSRSRSYRRRRGRSSSYSDYSRSRSYSTSRSRSHSRRRRKRSYTRSRSRSYSSTSYSSRSRSRNRSYRKARRKHRRKKIIAKERSVSIAIAPLEKEIAAKKKSEKEDNEKIKEEKEKVDPSEIPLPDLSGKKDDERTEGKLLKLKGKKRRTDVGETVAKLVESLPADIPLPFSEGVTKTVSSDSLPSGPPCEAPKETDTGFIGPKMPGPPPPPPHMAQRFPPNHGPPGPPRPGGYMHGQWDHWDAPGPWDNPPGPWDGGPGPGPRPPYRGMRPPYDPRMYGPYDPRRRGPPPHYMSRPRGPHPYMGPRYPGPHGPHPDYGYEHSEYDYAEDDKPKNISPPPLPKDPPKQSSPRPPLPKKKEKDQAEPEQNPDIVIPPEQAEQYKHLQKQAAKHARRQLRKQAKKELGEPDEDSTSSESEPEEQPEEVEEMALMEEALTPHLVAVPQMVIQPQPAGSPSGAYIIVSGGQQYIVQPKPQFVQTGMPIQAGQPVMAVSQGAIMATAAAAAAGAHPAHIMQQVPLGGAHMLAAPGLGAGVPIAMASAASIQHLQQVQQVHQLQQLQQLQQIQQAQAIQAHNQAVAAAAVQQGPIVVGNRILVPTLGVRPAM